MLRNDVYQRNLIAFVVDEAHCVKKWYEKYKYRVDDGSEGGYGKSETRGPHVSVPSAARALHGPEGF